MEVIAFILVSIIIVNWKENHHYRYHQTSLLSLSLMLFVFLTLRLHPGAFAWGRVLTQEVVLSGYKVPPGVSKTEAQSHSVEGLRACLLLVSFTLFFHLYCLLFGPSVFLSVCLSVCVFVWQYCAFRLFNAVCVSDSVSTCLSAMSVCFPSILYWCLYMAFILASRVVVCVIKRGNTSRANLNRFIYLNNKW